LFYDLVFVFAVTQVTHLLINDVNWAGAGRATLALLVVWWAWNYTTWVTNELDPAATAVKLLLLAVMFASLAMAIAIPEAFGSRALLFAGAYVCIQLGRHTFLTFVAADAGSVERERAGRILIWFVASGVLWIAGALIPAARTWLWLAALALDYLAPLALFWLPGARNLQASTWHVQTSHFAERFQLFIIIALGETIASIGESTTKLAITPGRAAAATLGFVATAAFWWLYFTRVAHSAEERLEAAEDRTTVARNGFTYLHAVLVAGIVESAVGAEIVIRDPTRPLDAAHALAVVANSVIYLAGLSLFRLAMTGRLAPRRMIAALVCLALYPLGTVTAPVVLVGALTVVLVGLIVIEQPASQRFSLLTPPSRRPPPGE
jgi:low temperature requirement protein LtrA